MKKIIKYLMFFMVVFTLCVTVKAENYYTILDTQMGQVDEKASKEFPFTVPTDSKVNIVFVDEVGDYFDDNYWSTNGRFLFQILDSEGNVISEQKEYLYYEGITISKDLTEGNYTFKISNNEYYSYDKYIFSITAVPVTNAAAESIAMEKSSVTLVKGKSTKLKVNVNPVYSVGDIYFKSSNTNIATVDSTGKVVAKNLGQARIYAQRDELTTSSLITVNKTATQKLIKKKKISFTKYVKYISGYKKAKWSSSKKSVATVNKKGVVVTKNSGTANIYAKIKGKTYTIPIKVVPLVSVSSEGVDEAAIYNDAYVRVVNNSSKAIKYMTLQITQYDNKGSKLRSPYSYYYINETIPAKSSDSYTFWVHNDTKRIKVKIKKVWFKGGGTWRP